jgi:hypothetical protein
MVRKIRVRLQAHVRENIVQSHISEGSNWSDTRIIQIRLIKAVDKWLVLAKGTDFYKVGVAEVSTASQLCNSERRVR